LLTYLATFFRAAGLYSHCMQGTLSQCIGSGFVPPLDPKLLVWGTKPAEAGEYLSNKYEIRISKKISVIPSEVFPQLLN